MLIFILTQPCVFCFSSSSEAGIISPGDTWTTWTNGPIRKLKAFTLKQIWSLKTLCSSAQKGIGPLLLLHQQKKFTVSFNGFTSIFSFMTNMINFIFLFLLCC